MKKKLLSLAVGSALGLSAISMPAQADSLLFPIFIHGGGFLSFLSLRSDGGGADLGANPQLAPDQIHYVWNYLDTNTGQDCIHADRTGNMTPRDLIQQTVVSPVLDGGIDLQADFGDASNPQYLNVSPSEGFMTVRDTSFEGAFGGQMIIVNARLGLVTAYKGFNDPLNTSSGDFNSIFVSQVSNDLTWYPVSVIDTSWFVIVTGSGMDNPAGWGGSVVLSHGFGGVYDRDENFNSGGRTVPITCRGVVDLQDLLTADQQVATQNGGWTWLINTPVPLTGATGVLMTKFESSADALGFPTSAISQENAFPNFPY